MIKKFKQWCLLLLIILLVPNVNAQGACEEDSNNLFNRLIGYWDEFEISDSGTKHTGIFLTKSIAEGCAIRQIFSTDNIGVESESLIYKEEVGTWREVIAYSDGAVIQYRWSENEEELILEQLVKAGPNKQRLVISDIGDNEYYLIDERSSDWGQTWTFVKKIKRVRVNEKDVEPEIIK